MATITASGPLSTVQWTGNNNIDALMKRSWDGTTIWANHSVTYSFPDVNSSWDSQYYNANWNSPTVAGGFRPLNSAQQQTVRDILAIWSDVANINFIEVSETSSSVGDIRIGYSNIGGMAGFSNGPMESSIAGDLWLNSNQYNSSYAPGQLMNFVIMHELGHALGFKHPMPDSDMASRGLDRSLPTEVDNHQYTIMSYTSGSGYNGVYPSTPMLFDIQAIQHMYGANNNTRTGNDVYTVLSTSPTVMTIWDAGGTDTISASDSTRSVTIDLREGHFSSIRAYMTDNIGIAYGVVIENAIAGSGNDTLISNSYSNILNGGAGVDTVQYDGARSNYTITQNSTGHTVTDNVGTIDTLTDIERLQFSNNEILPLSSLGVDVTFNEPNATMKNYFLLTLLTQTTDIVAHFSTQDLISTATAGQDYISTSQTATILAGTKTYAFGVDILSDNYAESQESIVAKVVLEIVGQPNIELTATHTILANG